jgi:hypothetical protein
MNDPSYKFYIAYNPNDMNIIDLYTAQDIEDRIYGEYFQKNSYICSLESLANLESHEKKARVAIYNKKINKAMKELAVNFRAKYAVNKDIANAAISDQGLIDVARDQTRQVEQIIKSHMPAEAIVHALDEAAESNGNDTVNYDDAFSPESISSMNKIDVAD